MTYSLLCTAAVSLTALSLSACMSGSNSPWTPEFGQASAPQHQQATYGQSQYQYAQYPMPSAHANEQDAMVNDYLATLGLAGSQYLSPLPNTYPPQPTARTQATQSSTWNGQQQYNAPYSSSATTQSYQQPAQRQNPQSYQSNRQHSYQSPYAPSTPSMSSPARPQAAPMTYGNTQPKTYGNVKPAPVAPRQSTYGHAMKAPTPAPAPQRSTYGQAIKAPMAPQSNMYGRSMTAPQNPYGRNMNAPMSHTQSPMMQPQGPQSNMIPWGQAMAWMYQGQVKSVMQSHKGAVTMVLHNGQTAETQSPQIDDVLRLKQDCGGVCQNMTVATE